MKFFVVRVLFVTALLLGNLLSALQASVTGPAQADGDPSPASACQMCCQGPAALPGIPGQHGNPGSKGDAGQQGQPGQKGEIGLIGPMGERGPAGNPGPKGDDGIGRPGKLGPRGLQGLVGATGPAGVKGQKGEIGPMGEPGPAGNPGPKGDDGIGRSGKIGPRGLQGLVGATGPAGVKGQKGEPGETPDTSNQRVAFTVVRTSQSDTSTSYDTRLPFEETETLVPGTSFDLQTGTFTCRLPGTYVFMFSVLKHSGSSYLRVYLWKNGDVVVSGGSDSSHIEQVSGSAVLVLQPEDTVYLTMNGRAYSDSPHYYTSFSGFLLYPE